MFRSTVGSSSSSGRVNEDELFQQLQMRKEAYEARVIRLNILTAPDNIQQLILPLIKEFDDGWNSFEQQFEGTTRNIAQINKQFHALREQLAIIEQRVVLCDAICNYNRQANQLYLEAKQLIDTIANEKQRNELIGVLSTKGKTCNQLINNTDFDAVEVVLADIRQILAEISGVESSTDEELSSEDDEELSSQDAEEFSSLGDEEEFTGLQLPPGVGRFTDEELSSERAQPPKLNRRQRLKQHWQRHWHTYATVAIISSLIVATVLVCVFVPPVTAIIAPLFATVATSIIIASVGVIISAFASAALYLGLRRCNSTKLEHAAPTDILVEGDERMLSSTADMTQRLHSSSSLSTSTSSVASLREQRAGSETVGNSFAWQSARPSARVEHGQTGLKKA